MITRKIFKAMILLVTVVLELITRFLQKLNVMLKFCSSAKPLCRKFSRLITRKIKFLFRVKKSSLNFKIKLVFSFVSGLSTVEIFTRNGIVNRLEYGVQASSCRASFFSPSVDKRTAENNSVGKYFLNKIIANESFLIKSDTDYQLHICFTEITKKTQRSSFYVFFNEFFLEF